MPGRITSKATKESSMFATEKSSKATKELSMLGRAFLLVRQTEGESNGTQSIYLRIFTGYYVFLLRFTRAECKA